MIKPSLILFLISWLLPPGLSHLILRSLSLHDFLIFDPASAIYCLIFPFLPFLLLFIVLVDIVHLLLQLCSSLFLPVLHQDRGYHALDFFLFLGEALVM